MHQHISPQTYRKQSSGRKLQEVELQRKMCHWQNFRVAVCLFARSVKFPCGQPRQTVRGQLPLFPGPLGRLVLGCRDIGYDPTCGSSQSTALGRAKAPVAGRPSDSPQRLLLIKQQLPAEASLYAATGKLGRPRDSNPTLPIAFFLLLARNIPDQPAMFCQR